MPHQLLIGLQIDCLRLLDHPNVIQYYGTATGKEAFMGHFIITGLQRAVLGVFCKHHSTIF